ncbi:heat shock protein [Candidatus Blochmanniella pennsylvanica str. BPEN]|uniref:Heat shock protein n=1 Tax=Blochmanniella pennsylvanica (strain BPEN) TaxID=291272 RepID=Q492L5_BLOPB|nr:protease HtpX [Candidatus Blochmannia pennsylvanicus]AAZ41082.1 heat shock protein [Candidatus Blochmannia pennsylvanicus str. BPEN]UOY04287.1 protease HtpX [Candidatus Blochmannia pennsylvanicus]
MMRIILFLITNLSVMILFGSILSLLGCWSSTTFELMKMAGIFGFGGAFISLLLSKSIALSAVNGLIISQASNDVEHLLLKIINVQAKKLNIVAPQLAIYDSIDMNAFATGARRNSALIAVSTGLLKNMNTESIEAVVAHEMNHIASGDMITMTLIQGIINTFVIFVSRSLAAMVFYWTSFINDQNDEQFDVRSSNHCDINNSMVYIIVSIILEVVFGMFASIIVFWFSRYREFYADAGAAKLVGCRNVIAALQELKHSYTLNTSNHITTLYINSVKKSILSDLFASHPSLDKRIEALQHGTYLNKSSYFFK